MDLRLLAGVFCGSALTLAVVSFAAPRPESPCTMQIGDINTRLSEMEKHLATMPALLSDVSALITANTANVKWQGDAMQKLDEVNMNLLHFQYSTTLRH
jgi:hypothetical protein